MLGALCMFGASGVLILLDKGLWSGKLNVPTYTSLRLFTQLVWTFGFCTTLAWLVGDTARMLFTPWN